MNYRHEFHAGNFADAMKHALLVQLVRALQRKEKGFLYLDTHAGRGGYDLEVASVGDSLARRPEWPDGIGRLWQTESSALPPAIAEYVELVRRFDRGRGNLAGRLRYYPGSPCLASQLARPVERLVLCEKHPAELAALRQELAARWVIRSYHPSGSGGATADVRGMDGYEAVRALLPPPERRALVLIDPPYEAPDEFAAVVRALREGLERLRSGVFVVWYPLTGRARIDVFFAELQKLAPPPTLACELAIAGEQAGIKMRGCGLVVTNPPWRFDRDAESVLGALADLLAQAPGGGARVQWIVPE